MIIESDDWGLERCTNEEGFANLCKKYPESIRTRWFYDSLETNYDLDRLFGLLESHSDNFIKKPTITGNFITFNVDYTTLDKLNLKGISQNNELPREAYLEAISKKIFYPQLHGYSNYNNNELSNYFLDKDGYEDFLNGFFVAINTTRGNTKKFHGEYSDENLNFQREIKLAQIEFNNVFGFDSISVIPCTFVLDKSAQENLINNNFKIIQGANRLRDSRHRKRHLPVLRFKRGVLYNLRNARLDVHPDYEKFANTEMLERSMERAFKYRQPCVVDFHRVNFVSKYSQKWADNCLFELDKFFKYCRSKHPEIIFMNTVEFYKYLRNNCTLNFIRFLLMGLFDLDYAGEMD